MHQVFENAQTADVGYAIAPAAEVRAATRQKLLATLPTDSHVLR